MNNTHAFLWNSVWKKTEPYKENVAKNNLFYDILILKGEWKISLARILIKLKTLSLSMILKIFLVFWQFELRDSYKKDSYKIKMMYSDF